MKHIKTFEQLNEGLISSANKDQFERVMKRLVDKYDLEDTGMTRDMWTMSNNPVLDVEYDDWSRHRENMMKLFSAVQAMGWYVADISFGMSSFTKRTDPSAADDKYHPGDKDDLAEVIDKYFKHQMKDYERYLSIEFERTHDDPATDIDIRLDDYMYHITEHKYIDRIKKQGIVPRSKNKNTAHPDRIYAANAYGLSKILDDYLGYVANPVMIIIPKKTFEKVEWHKDPNSPPGNYYTTENIPPVGFNYIRGKYNIENVLKSAQAA